jgi:oxalate decarboxylase/phosphoglucose isomerase-like protein (cupin superfamily)
LANVSLWEVEIAAKSPGAPPHTHTHEDEIYVVLEGEMTFLIGEDVVTAGPGATVALPRGGLHATWNEGDAPVRALTFISQDSAFEHFFDRVVERVVQEGAASPAEAAGIVGAVAAEIGVEIDMGKLPDRARPLFGLA